ncbi:hypothetical protein HDF11_004910 [Tunturiibacter psychrotolerans]
MRKTEELQTIFKSLVHVALGAYRLSLRRSPLSLLFNENDHGTNLFRTVGNKSFFP